MHSYGQLEPKTANEKEPRRSKHVMVLWLPREQSWCCGEARTITCTGDTPRDASVVFGAGTLLDYHTPAIATSDLTIFDYQNSSKTCPEP